MEQESAYKNIAIIGCGAAGGLISILLSKYPYNRVTAFDTKDAFATLRATGGGRCNLTNGQEDIKEFVKNYPRGEKFLISIFTKFNQKDTRKLFNDLGIRTYVQADGRVFPESNSAIETIKILKEHLMTSNFELKKEKVIDIEKKEEYFIIETNKKKYKFDKVVIATGGKGNGFDLAKSLGHNIIECRPSLCSLEIKEKEFYRLSGLGFKDVEITTIFNKKKIQKIKGDILFTHKSITGPLIFKISANCAYLEINKENTLELNIKFKDIEINEIEDLIRENTKKSIKNVFSMIMPESYISLILERNNIDGNKQISQIKKKEKETIINSIENLKLNAISRIKDTEIVTAGGIDINEINNKTMESKIVKGLYCIGEVTNIDGYTGGFNLQIAYSTGYTAGIN